MERTVGPLTLPAKVEQGGARIYHAQRNGHAFAAHVTLGIEGGPFTSLWFNSPHSPCASHVDCARQVARELDVTVRCDPGAGVSAPSIFLQVSGEHEGLVDCDSLAAEERLR